MGPVSADDVAEFRCDYTQGPLKPVILEISEGWEFSFTGATAPADLIWHDRVDIEFPTFPKESGTVRVFLSADETAVPGPETVVLWFRSADYSASAPATQVQLQLNMLAPTPAPEPAVPFDPVLDCSPSTGAVAGASQWAMQDCLVTWQTKNVNRVELRAVSEGGGWSVIAVDESELSDPAALDASDGVLSLVDSNSNDDGFYSARVFIGTRIACTSPLSSQVDLQLVASSRAPASADSGGNNLDDINSVSEVIETVNETLTVSATMPAAPDVRLVSASFTPINYGSGERVSTGTISIRYENAPVGCPWFLVLEVGNFQEIESYGDVQYQSVSGVPVGVLIGEAGEITISPASDSTPLSGDMTVTIQFRLAGYAPHGSYETTIAIRSELQP